MTAAPGYGCPSCGGRTDVKDSRPRESGGIRRRRLCQGCGARFTTFEVRAEDVDGVMGSVQDLPSDVIQNATRLVNCFGRLSRDDRQLLLGIARRFEGKLDLSSGLRENIPVGGRLDA